MKISYLVTTHNEGKYVSDLLLALDIPVQLAHDEIVVLDDNSTDPLTKNILDEYRNKDHIKIYDHPFSGNFAEHKNFGNSLCQGDYIFQLDADELPPSELVTHIHEIVKNTNADLINVPRVNVVHGLTPEDVRRWGWQVNDKGWVMFPDYQTRIYRNTPSIKWVGHVHERITGHKTHTFLPPEEVWSIKHYKTIERQRSQNQLYEDMSK